MNLKKLENELDTMIPRDQLEFLQAFAGALADSCPEKIWKLAFDAAIEATGRK